MPHHTYTMLEHKDLTTDFVTIFTNNHMGFIVGPRDPKLVMILPALEIDMGITADAYGKPKDHPDLTLAAFLPGVSMRALTAYPIPDAVEEPSGDVWIKPIPGTPPRRLLVGLFAYLSCRDIPVMEQIAAEALDTDLKATWINFVDRNRDTIDRRAVTVLA